MEEKTKATIFHVYRKDGSSIFLYPMIKGKNVLSLFETNDFTGVYGKEPRVESLTLLRNDLYRMIEQSVKEWSAERKFIPRFLISTGCFLLVYLLASVVIRDPLPMIDEILIGLAAAAGLYFFLARKDTSSREVTEKKVRLRMKVDEIVFNEDSFVKDAEQYLQKCEDAEDIEKLLMNMLADEDNIMHAPEELRKVEQFLEYISLMYDQNAIKKHEKMLSKMKKGNDSQQKQMVKWLSSRKVDPFLFAVYTKYKKQS